MVTNPITFSNLFKDYSKKRVDGSEVFEIPDKSEREASSRCQYPIIQDGKRSYLGVNMGIHFDFCGFGVCFEETLCMPAYE